MTLDRVSITLLRGCCGPRSPPALAGWGAGREAAEEAPLCWAACHPRSWVPRDTNSREPLVSMAKPRPRAPLTPVN